MKTTTHTSININTYDPTRTTVLRNMFVRDVRRRFDELTTVIRRAVDEEDCFGLRPGTVRTFQLTSPGAGQFAFPRSADKVEAFIRWLEIQQERGWLEVRTIEQVGVGIEGAWTNRYVFDSYKRGVIRARYELKKAGFSVPDIDATGGIIISMSTPFHIDRLGLLYSRVFSELKGITAIMDQQISRILAQGIADGDNPRLLARKLVSVINGTGMGELGITDTLGRFIPARRRAEILARTEIIRAHHQATIQEYRNWALEGVYVQAEWVTAGDDRVCKKCEEKTKDSNGNNIIYTLDEIEPMIPLHPQCRCVALPYLGGEVGEEIEPKKIDMTHPNIEKDRKLYDILKQSSTRSAELVEGGSKLADSWLEKLVELRGIDGTPNVLSQAAFDKLEGNVLFRGVTQSEYVSAFKTGKYYGGTGVYGSGHYFVGGVDAQAGYRSAKGFALGEDANLIRMKLPSNAKVIKWDNLRAEMEVWSDEVGKEVGFSKINKLVEAGKITEEEASIWMSFKNFASDPGRYAVLKGYDVIEIPNMAMGGNSYWVVINRSILNVLQ